MNEPVDCWVCDRPGKLRLDTYPQVMVHDRGPGQRPKLCTLPPRDDRIPRITPQRVYRYPSPYREAS